jgi:hypothetical protein
MSRRRDLLLFLQRIRVKRASSYRFTLVAASGRAAGCGAKRFRSGTLTAVKI